MACRKMKEDVAYARNTESRCNLWGKKTLRSSGFVILYLFNWQNIFVFRFKGLKFYPFWLIFCSISISSSYIPATSFSNDKWRVTLPRFQAHKPYNVCNIQIIIKSHVYKALFWTLVLKQALFISEIRIGVAKSFRIIHHVTNWWKRPICTL